MSPFLRIAEGLSQAQAQEQALPKLLLPEEPQRLYERALLLRVVGNGLLRRQKPNP